MWKEESVCLFREFSSGFPSGVKDEAWFEIETSDSLMNWIPYSIIKKITLYLSLCIGFI